MEFTHIANPVRVQALVINDLSRINNGIDTLLFLADGSERTIGPEMTSRYKPVPGDYLVCQEDGYTYLNPKDVFERKYRVIGAELVSEKPARPEYRSHANEDQLRAMALDYASRHYAAGSVEVVRAASAYYDFLKGGSMIAALRKWLRVLFPSPSQLAPKPLRSAFGVPYDPMKSLLEAACQHEASAQRSDEEIASLRLEIEMAERRSAASRAAAANYLAAVQQLDLAKPKP